MARIVWLIFCWLVLLAVPAKTEGEYLIGSPCTLRKCMFQEVKSIVREAYGRIGRSVTFMPLPVRRELHSANAGSTDATLVRVDLGPAESANLVKVPFPLLRAVIGPVMIDPAIRVEGLEDLARYKVGILRGGVVASLLCARAGVVPDRINGIDSALRMLREGRIDVYVEDLALASVAAGELGIGIRVGEPFYWGYFYHWVHKRHEALVPELARVFKEMLADGSTARLLGKYAGMAPESHWDD